jgi:DnaJ-class molecular chaperone
MTTNQSSHIIQNQQPAGGKRLVACQFCHGTGFTDYEPVCSVCQGQGKIYISLDEKGEVKRTSILND